jgi:hypothetical protein
MPLWTGQPLAYPTVQKTGAAAVFVPGFIQAVKYEARSQDIREGGAIEPSPFKKALKYRPQAEVRILLVPKEQVTIPEEQLIVEIADPVSLFMEVFKNYQQNRAPGS